MRGESDDGEDMLCCVSLSRLINFLPRTWSWRIVESVGERPPVHLPSPAAAGCRASSSAHDHRRQDTGELLADLKICRYQQEDSVHYMVKCPQYREKIFLTLSNLPENVKIP